MNIVGYYLNCDTAVCVDCAPTPTDETDCDDGYPAPIYDDMESDTPTHCANCEALIPHALTDDGYRYVEERIAGHLADPTDGRACVLAAWWREYGAVDRMDLVGILNQWANAQPTHDFYSPAVPA